MNSRLLVACVLFVTTPVVATEYETLELAATCADQELDRLLANSETDTALASLNESVRIHAELYEAEPQRLAAYLDSLADRLFFAAEGSAALWEAIDSCYRQALAIRIEVLGESHLDVAETLTNLASLAYYRGRWNEAEDLDRQSLTIRQEVLGDHHQGVGDGWLGLAMTVFQQGRFGEGEELFDRALEILEPGPARANGLNGLAELHRAQGNYAAAIAGFEASLEMLRPAEPPDPRLRAAVLNNLALLHIDLSDYARAETLLAQATELWQQGEGIDPYQAIIGRHTRAELYRRQGRLDEAERLFRGALSEARELLGTNNSRLVLFLNELAALLTERDRLAEAEPFAGEALALVRSSSPPGHPLVAQALHDHAHLLRRIGKSDEAVAELRKALGIREASLGRDHPEVAMTLTELATCLAAGDQMSQDLALEHVRRAIGIFSSSVAYPLVEAEARALEADLLERQGKLQEAVKGLASALELIERMRPQSGGGDVTRANLLSHYAEHYYRMVEWQVRLGDLDAAIQYAERGRARVLLDQLAVGKVDLRSRIPAEVLVPLEDEEGKYRALLAEIQAQLRFTLGRTDLDSRSWDEKRTLLEREIEVVTSELQRVGNEIRSASPLWREVITAGGRSSSTSLIQERLVPADGLMLVYQIGEKRSFVFAIPPVPGEVTAYPLEIDDEAAHHLGLHPGSLRRLDLSVAMAGGRGMAQSPLIEDLMTQVRGLSKIAVLEEGVNGRLYGLFHLLFPSSLWQRVESAREVVIIADASLHQLPFEALVVESPIDDEGVVYWLDRGPVVRYAPSATTLYNLAARTDDPDPGGMVLVVSDPIFDSGEKGSAPLRATYERAGVQLERLPGTAAEARAIRGAYGDPDRSPVRNLEGSSADERAVRAALAEKPRILHFATHGLVDQQRNAMLAALALTPPAANSSDVADIADDGFLQLFEIYELDLDADLSVLSACESHIGRQVAGEGVFALSRGFLAAGSRRVIASQWPVDDASTAVLMGELYARIVDFTGEPDYARALRDARRTIRNRPEWAAPFFWAPFVFSGLR